MKYVPENLNEYHQFERGKDPRTAMDVGMNPLVKEIDSMDLFWLFQATSLVDGSLVDIETFSKHPMMDSWKQTREIYERTKKNYELLSPFLEWEGPVETYEEAEAIHKKAQNSGKYAYDFTPEGDNISAVISSFELPKADKIMDVAEWMEEGNRYNYGSPNTNESVNFERGVSPKESMKVGVNSIIPSITSDDLQDLVMYYMEGEEEIRNLIGDDEEYDENYGPEWWDRMERINLALKGKIKIVEYYDWKEFDEMNELIDRKRGQRSPYQYFYNASPGQDGILLIMSKIPLPSAEDASD